MWFPSAGFHDCHKKRLLSVGKREDIVISDHILRLMDSYIKFILSSLTKSKTGC